MTHFYTQLWQLWVMDTSMARSDDSSPGPPRDNFILRPEELQWSEQDFLGGRVAPRDVGSGEGHKADYKMEAINIS